ncbi:MAG: hypothetical protein DA407_07355 [Bacteroidetes bacterium]|nr:MAG: hypothetical protein DA407_07355 [Bacteroidota bacterium]
MKNTKNIFGILCLIVIMSCSNDTASSSDENTPSPPILTNEIEVYEDDLFNNNLVLVLENGGESAFLVNKEGERKFTWNFDNKLGNDFELLPNGNAIGIFKTDNPAFSIGGYGGIVRIIKPNGSIDWEFEYSSSTYLSHHDVEMLPNGNVLILVWELIDTDTSGQNGVDTNVVIYPEKIIEVNPSTDQIVWEWRSWDHIIQEFDDTKLNYGIIADNPHRINVNYEIPNNGDLMHANGFDYDDDKDVIYLSVNNYSEVWVIDHSTTSIEATGSTGGTYGKGGDLVYRFGNPSAYNNSFGERLFYNNHFPNLIENGEPGDGNMLIYMNGNNIYQSSVFEFEIPNDFNLTPNSNNEPTLVWSYTHPDLYNGKISGANRLSNGNTLICEGDYGYWEVTTDGEIAWKYNGTSENYWRGYPYDLDDEALPFLGLTF